MPIFCIAVKCNYSKVMPRNHFLTPCCQLRTLANTFVVVCILCTEITSWLPDAAYFACCSSVAFKVYPVEWKRKNEGRGGEVCVCCSSKGSVPLTHYRVSYLCDNFLCCFCDFKHISMISVFYLGIFL